MRPGMRRILLPDTEKVTSELGADPRGSYKWCNG